MDKVVAYIPILHIVAAVFAVIELGLTAYSKSMTPQRGVLTDLIAVRCKQSLTTPRSCDSV